MKIAIADFETTGLPEYKMPSAGNNQPYMVSATVILRNGPHVQTSWSSVITSPVTSDEEAFQAHGLTPDYLTEYGVSPVKGVLNVWKLVSQADLFVAHNAYFDYRILRTALKRFLSEAAAEEFKEMPRYCTMNNFGKWKGLKRFDKGKDLDSASEGLCNLPKREGNHGSFEDAWRCMKCFDALVDLGFGPDKE